MSAKTGKTKPEATAKEYGRRPYVSDRGYDDQMRSPTDRLLMWQLDVKHSEFKKPYMDDEGYDEMEYWLPPKPGFTDFDKDVDWGLSQGALEDGVLPESYYEDPEMSDEDQGFLGCVFYVPLTPRIANPGDIVRGRIERRDDPVTKIETEGPIEVLSLLSDLQNCVSSYQGTLPSSPECAVVARLADDFGEYAVANVILTTATGRRCNNIVVLSACLDSSTLEWDDAESGDTVARSDSVTVAVTGTDVATPLEWTVSGTGFTLTKSTTTGLTNTLNAGASACGRADITVTDSCGNVVTGAVKCTTGGWQACSGSVSPNMSYCSGGEGAANRLNEPANSPDGLYRALNPYSNSWYYKATGNDPANSDCDGTAIALSYIEPTYVQGGAPCEGPYCQSNFAGGNPTFYYWGCN